ncbi:DNA-binding helix-turn-helix protein [Deinococcus grandis]|uniref:DNA-binding helix-turn-helix protein n=2 Tax=Deinococcus grandis TaxID=57498 RepID=A0A124BSC4_9DEIO|nr:DNA-binding helix-turn-helix protein [Deinococcus grandis]
MNMTEEIRAEIKRLMRQKGLTQRDLAAKLGISEKSLSRTLRDRGQPPGLWPAIFDEFDVELTLKRKERRESSSE